MLVSWFLPDPDNREMAYGVCLSVEELDGSIIWIPIILEPKTLVEWEAVDPRVIWRNEPELLICFASLDACQTFLYEECCAFMRDELTLEFLKHLVDALDGQVVRKARYHLLSKDMPDRSTPGGTYGAEYQN